MNELEGRAMNSNNDKCPKGKFKCNQIESNQLMIIEFAHRIFPVCSTHIQTQGREYKIISGILNQQQQCASFNANVPDENQK